MSRAKDWLVACAVLLLGRRRRGLRRPGEPEDRIVARGPHSPGAELIVVAALGVASLCAIAFVVIYALGSLPAHTQLLGVALGLCFAALAFALLVLAQRVVPDEEVEEEYHETTPGEQLRMEQLVTESTEAFTRKRLLLLAAGGAAGTLGVALLAPAVSLGPVFDLDPYYATPWRRGRRLVDEDDRPLRAGDIHEDVFYTAFPEGVDKERFSAPLVLVRLPEAELALPPERRGWAPGGIVAYSRICTHAGCAITMYRAPLFQPDEPRPALVCPCHYSTFDPATGGKVEFGPAGRALPQLPLMIDGSGFLRAAGNFSDPIGPSWWGVRMREPS